MNNEKHLSLLKQILISFIFSIILLFLLFIWQSSIYSVNIESQFLKWISLIKNSNNKSNDNEFEKKVLFIDAGSSKMLLPNSKGVGNQAVVDRLLLDSLLKTLFKYSKNNQVIICDLFFDQQSIFDSALAQSISNAKNLFFPTPIDDTSSILNNSILLNTKTGNVEYSLTNTWWELSDYLLKFKLVSNGGRKSLPLVVFESISHKEAVLKNGLLWINGDAYFNNISVDENIRNYSLIVDGKYSTVMTIEDVLLSMVLGNNILPKQLEDKEFLVIGNFESDIHETAFGPTCGAFINYNIILSLLKESNKITVTWIFFLIISFMGVIHFEFYGHKNRRLYKLKRNGLKWFGIMGSHIFSIGAMVLLISSLSYYIFNISVDIIVAGFLISLFLYLKKILTLFYYSKEKISLHFIVKTIFLQT